MTDVADSDQPDLVRCLDCGTANYEALASSLFRNWYGATYSYGASSPAHTFSVVSDNTSCSWGDASMRSTSSEPRLEWNNTVSFPYEHVTSGFFNLMHINLADARRVLVAKQNGYNFGSYDVMISAWVKFNQALTLSNLALTFDQAYIITEENNQEDIESPVLFPSIDIAEKAISLFDEVISISGSNSFSIPSSYMNGVNADNILLAQLANSYAARLLAYMPRTAAENSNVNWASVRDYALAGITSDFSILMDDIRWSNDFKWTQTYPGWARADMRIINMMDSSYPSHNTNGQDFAVPDSAVVFSNVEIDNRILTDFEHLSSNNFNPVRGLYHFSSFRLNRYDDYTATWSTKVSELQKAENDMLLAEAYLELNDIVNAATIINTSTRITRGGLSMVVTAEEIDAAIHHERQIELSVGSYGVTFFDMRKRDLLQKGTFLELPIPAKTLELLQTPKPYYTFGGDNSSTSQGGWRD